MTASIVREAALRPPPTLSWAENNQRWLVAELDDLAARLAGNASPARSADDDENFTPALERIVTLFGLSTFEREILLLATGLELHQGLRDAIAAMNSGTSTASFGAALGALVDPHWDAMSPDAPLRAWDLVRVEAGAPLAQASLRVDERIMHFVTGVAAGDVRLRGIVDFVDHAQVDLDDRDEQLAYRLETLGDGALVLRSEPYDAASERAIAVSALARRDTSALRIGAHDLPTEPAELATIARLIDREAALSAAMPVLTVHDTANERAATGLVARLRTGVIVIGTAAPALQLVQSGKRITRIDVNRTQPGLLRAACRESEDKTVGDALKNAAAQFDPPSDALDDIVSRTRATSPEQRSAEAWSAARAASRGGLDALAQRIVSTATFDDLVLPAAQLAALRDIASQLQHRERVFREWGFAERHARGQGLTALFAGESGTGKTLAAEVIANAVSLDLYRVDLATVVSKYIGETEKNLKRVFDAAESSGAVLLFDEADALFGKRSEVKDSHDRYANIEVAYLLQRVEAYRGLAILTTNMKSALDRAFLRRLRFVVHFPFPDSKAREQIWRREFPSAAPLRDVDFGALGKLNVSGGSIHSIALNAAFKAADSTGVIDHETLMSASRAELAKLERPFGHAAERV